MKTFVSDTELKAINTALDVDAMMELLQRRIHRPEDFAIQEIKILDVQYKPATSCKILYQLKLRNCKTGRTIRHLLSASLHRRGDSDPEISAQILTQIPVEFLSIFPERVISVPELQMVVYEFPLDPVLPWLSDALNPSSLKMALHRNWTSRNRNIRRVTVRSVGYTPQARAALSCEFVAESKDSGEPEVRRLIGKMHGHKLPALLFSGAWALWHVAKNRLRVAPPVGYLSSLHLTLQEHVRGERLTEFAHSPTFVKPVRKTAHAIRQIHGLTLPLTATRNAEKEAVVILRWAAVLAAICPAETLRIERLSREIVQDLTACIQVKSPVHGDFHPANVMWDDHHITLVDLDDLSYGDPLVDTGRFLASLRVSALRVSSEISALKEVQETFLQRYLKDSGEDEKRARLFEAASLLIAACAPFRLQRPNWNKAAFLILEEAERVWESSRGMQRSLPAEVSRKAPVEASEWIRDGIYMQTVLDPLVRKIYNAELSQCRVSKVKADHDKELRYELYGWKGSEKWEKIWRGTVWKERGAGAVVPRLEALRQATLLSTSAPLLPLPICYIRRLSLIIWEAPGGQPFTIRKDSMNGRTISLAKALAAMHSIDANIQGERSKEMEMQAIRKRVNQLGDENSPLHKRAHALLKEIDRRSQDIDWSYAPVLRRLHPRNILFSGDRVAFSSLEKPVRSHPLVDAADFIARLTLMGIRQQKMQRAKTAAELFRSVYLSSSGTRHQDLVTFEIGALVRLACRYAEETTIAEELLNEAERLGFVR